MTRNEMKVLKMQLAMESAKATMEKSEYDMKVCQTRHDNATRRYNDAKEQLDKLVIVEKNDSQENTAPTLQVVSG